MEQEKEKQELLLGSKERTGSNWNERVDFN